MFVPLCSRFSALPEHLHQPLLISNTVRPLPSCTLLFFSGAEGSRTPLVKESAMSSRRPSESRLRFEPEAGKAKDASDPASHSTASDRSSFKLSPSTATHGACGASVRLRRRRVLFTVRKSGLLPVVASQQEQPRRCQATPHLSTTVLTELCRRAGLGASGTERVDSCDESEDEGARARVLTSYFSHVRFRKSSVQIPPISNPTHPATAERGMVQHNNDGHFLNNLTTITFHRMHKYILIAKLSI